MAEAINHTGNHTGKPSAGQDDSALALSALIWILGDPARADRLLALTGLDADALRHGLGETATLAAVLDFLCGHEADLIACARDLEVTPDSLARARERLTGERIYR
jgi:Protein of unknown function (DUF3572)